MTLIVCRTKRVRERERERNGERIVLPFLLFSSFVVVAGVVPCMSDPYYDGSLGSPPPFLPPHQKMLDARIDVPDRGRRLIPFESLFDNKYNKISYTTEGCSDAFDCIQPH